MKGFAVLGGFAVVLLTTSALACSFSPPPPPTQALAEASAVFIGRVVSVRHEPYRDDTGKIYPRFTIEYATMRVIKTWKGATVGEIVRFRTEIGPGPCGVSSVNSPTWVIEKNPHTGKESSAKFSREWLVYTNGNQPYELSMSSRSLPLNHVSHSELLQLDKTTKPRSAR